MRINPKNDYSALFNSSSQNNLYSSVSLANEHKSIKNGSYGKLLKAYYSKSQNANSSDWVKKNANVNDTKKISEVKSDAVDVKRSVTVINNKLIDSGNQDKIKTAIKEFADNYNSLVMAAKDSTNTSIKKQTKSLTNNTYVYSDLLKGVGITVNSDNTLSVNEDTLTQASASTLKTLFTNKGSFGDNTSTKASMIYNTANSALSTGGIYDNTASKNNTASIGGLFETYN